MRTDEAGAVARGRRAKEDAVLAYVRRVVRIAINVIGPALPVLAITIVGAKRW